MQGISPVARYGTGVSGGSGDLLTVSGGLTGTLKTVTDGDGTESILQLSTAQVNINDTPGDHSAAPSLSFGNGNTGIYESADNTLIFSSNGSGNLSYVGTKLGATNNDRAAMFLGPSGATAAGFRPGGSNDGDTGVGTAGADQLSLIAGGLEGIRVSEAAGAIITDLTGEVRINGQIKVTGGAPGLGKVLTSDADGLAAWATAINDQAASQYFDIGSMRIQWGSQAITTDAAVAVVLPALFASAVYFLALSWDDSWSSGGAVQGPMRVEAGSKTTAQFEVDRDDDVTGTINIEYIAIGLKP